MLQKILSASTVLFNSIPSYLLEKDIQYLCSIVKQLQSHDIFPTYITQKYIEKRRFYDYISILESKNFSCGIFTIPKDQCIPLHSHPDMYGFIKLVQGTVRVISYDPINWEDVNNGNFYAKVVLHKIINQQQKDVLTLSPKKSNFHNIYAVNGSAVFFDILAPPYDENRVCNYYENTSINKKMIEFLCTDHDIPKLSEGSVHHLISNYIE